MSYTVYTITGPTGVYIGVTSQALPIRWGTHLADAKRGLARPLYQAIRAFGHEAFTVREVERVEERYPAYRRERALLADYAAAGAPLLNLRYPGSGCGGVNDPCAHCGGTGLVPRPGVDEHRRLRHLLGRTRLAVTSGGRSRERVAKRDAVLRALVVLLGTAAEVFLSELVARESDCSATVAKHPGPYHQARLDNARAEVSVVRAALADRARKAA